MKDAPEQMPVELNVGDECPSAAFSIEGHVQLTTAELRGTPFVVYFYPRDNTPGCTQEACDFRDQHEELAQAGLRVIGVSRDTHKSHDGFRTKYSLPFHLASDPDFSVHREFGAYGTKMMYGKATQGTLRSTFLVDAAGIIRGVWRNVKVKGHVDDVLKAALALGA